MLKNVLLKKIWRVLYFRYCLYRKKWLRLEGYYYINIKIVQHFVPA